MTTRPTRRPRGSQPPRRPSARRTTRQPDALTEAQEIFAAAYVENGGNGTRAYRTAHPQVTIGTAAVEASKLLRIPKIQARVDALRKERWKRLEMEGDEAIALLSLSARASAVDVFDEDGTLLPVGQWPPEIGLAVKALKFKDGALESVTLHDGLKARELMAIATGRLKQALAVTHTFDHEKYLAGEESEGDGA